MTQRGKVVIFGAGGGLGRALVQVYSGAGFDALGVGRGDCDLRDPAAVARFLHGEAPRGAAVCIVAAGVSQAGYLDELPDGPMEECFQVNFLSPVMILRGLAASGCRRFVFILSGAADLLLPGLGPYALSKRALRDYLALVEAEGSFAGSRLLRVWPGGIATDFDKKTQVHGSFRPYPRRGGVRPVEEAAKRVFEAEQAGRRLLVLSPAARLLGRVQAAAPGLSSRVLRLAAPRRTSR